MKTEEPTPRRLRRARELGDSPVSHALGQALGLLVAVLLAPAALAACAERAGALLKQAIQGAQAAPERLLGLEVLSLSVPLLLAVAATVAIVGLVQTGGAVNAARVTPDLGRLDPVAGARNLWRADRLLALVRAFVATALVLLGVDWLFTRHAADLAAATGNAEAVGPLALELGHALGLVVALSGVGLGLVDLVVVGRLWRRRLRMTRDEVRREFREAEGDPELRAKRRRAHQEALAGSIVNAVREATVVIVNPTHLACALRYDEAADEAPCVVAQGAGDLARYIVDAARAYGIPCVRDVPVARALSELEIGDEIPEALYEAVAEILRELMGSGPAAQEETTGASAGDQR